MAVAAVTGRSLTRGIAAGVLLLIFLPSCRHPGPLGDGEAATGLKGRVTYRGEPLGEAQVKVYDSLEGYRRGGESASFGPTLPDGDFAIDLPPGAYYLTAEGRSPEEGGDLFNFHGSNPVTIAPGERVHVGLSLAPLPPPPRYADDPEEEGAGLAGVVFFESLPLAGAVVSLYLEGGKSFRGTPYALSSPTDEEGRFAFFNLIATDYYVVVRKRAAGRLAGPLVPGDYYGFYPFNPLRLQQGKRAGIGIEVIAKAEEPAAKRQRASATRIEGRIVDLNESPLEGLYAFVYPDRIMSHAKPLAISSPSGREGLFVLSLEQGGKFYLGARERYGINPQPGEYYGKYTGTPDHSISIREGEVRRGITIVVDRILE